MFGVAGDDVPSDSSLNADGSPRPHGNDAYDGGAGQDLVDYKANAAGWGWSWA